MQLPANIGFHKRTLSQQREGTWVPNFIICTIVAAIVLIPLLITIVGGFRSTGELLSAPLSIPKVWHWENYGNILNIHGLFWGNLVNSIVITTGTVALVLATACPAAFVLARIPFPGREVVFNIFLIGLLFPLAVAFLPLYILIVHMGMLDSQWGVILPQAAFGLPFSILVLRNFFRAVPAELEDAATIDGASSLTFFLQVLIPLARPAISVVSILAVVSSWNNFLLPLLVFADPSKATLPLGAMNYRGEYSSDWASILAYLTLAMVPAVILFFLAERQIVAGLTAGAVKG
jgi:raffinose/stachyose/melibiose transport system permease protein